ncbi:MAG: acetyl-CoA carboxylase biotin carboxyl carrier protein [Firmicutes bacterium]|nr:acetyl-CoA carboxylase biotin carboxyl carrier protein [Bacillota bacterium]
MDIRVIKAVLGLFEKSVLNKMEISEGDLKISLEKGTENIAPEVRVPTFNTNAHVPKIIASQEDKVIDFNNAKEVKSPMVGVFYAAASPDAAPFIKRGQKVKKGDVLCIIEAMKVLNEITSQFDGEIADICVENGELVEFSQVLVKIV